MIAEKERHNSPGTSRPWSSKEIADLRKYASLGAETVAELLGRPVWSVKKQAQRLRISLRRPGERGGLLLGQPRGVSFLRQTANRIHNLRALREDTLAGDVDVARIERRARLIAKGAELCPACGVRPQEIEATGLCEDCHLQALAEGHRLEDARAEAQRELDRERQRKHRRKEKSDG